jgi:hypothetical protein
MENPNPLIDDYYAVEYQNILLDSIEIDGEKAANVIVGGSTGFGDVGWVKHIILTNHGDKQYEIKLDFTGGEGIGGFGKNYNTLEDQILKSTKITN